MRHRTIFAITWILSIGLYGGPSTAEGRRPREEAREVPRNGVDDTAALEAALRSCSPGGPDCVVQLGAGVYRTRQVFVEGFHGSVRGRGMNRTTIAALPALAVTQDNGPLGAFTHDPSPTNPYPSLLTLWSGADVRFADLGFRVTEFDPTTGWYYGQDFFVTWLKAAVIIQGSASLEHVAFQGGPGTDDVVNLDNGPLIMKASGPVIQIRGCRTRRTGNGFEIGFVDHASITIGGSEEDGNVFEDNSSGGLFYGVGASTVEYSHNRVATAIAFWQAVTFFNGFDFDATGVTQVSMSHNQLTISGESLAGIYIADLWSLLETPTLDLSISDNRIDLDDASLAAGIDADVMSGGHLADNRIRGAGVAGISVSSVGGCLIEDNDLSRLAATVAPIWLKADSHDCTAVVDDATSVLDEGTDNTILVATD